MLMGVNNVSIRKLKPAG